MTTDRQAPMKPARPDLFAPKQATRMADERISVLASLDANPPAKKKARGRRAPAFGTLLMLGITGVVVAGVVYLVATHESEPDDAPSDEAAAAMPAPLPAVSAASSEAPALALSALANDAASAPAPASTAVEDSAPAAIETLPSEENRNPMTVLAAANTSHAAAASTATTRKAATPAPAANPLRALDTNTAASSAKTTKNAARPAPAPRAARPAGDKPAAIDTDIVLLEALVASSDRQKAREAAAHGKDKARAAPDAQSPAATTPPEKASKP